jgi:hypothetical protein
MKANSFRVVAPSLVLGLLLVTQALGRSQSPLALLHKTDSKPTATKGGALRPDALAKEPVALSASASSSTIATNQSIVNRIIHDEQLGLARNERLLAKQHQANERMRHLYQRTPMSEAIRAEIVHQTTLFNQIQHHLDLNKVHIGDKLPRFDAQVARSLMILGESAPGHPGLGAYILKAMQLQIVLSDRLNVIKDLPAATPFMPNP